MKRLFVILLFFILSWLLYCQVPNESAHFDIDSFGYQDLAVNFYYNNQLLNSTIPERAPVQPIGYPFFMGLVYKLFGVHVGAVIAVQVVLMVIVIVLLMAISLQLFGSAVASIAGVLAALNLSFLVYPQFVLAETVLLFLLMLFFYFFVRFYKQRSLKALYFSAFILGVSTVVKPTALCFPVLLIPAIIISLWPQRWQSFWAALIFMLTFLSPIFLYMGRNYFVYGYFSFAPMMPLNMYQCLLAKVMSRVEGLPIQDIIDTQLRFSALNTFDPQGWAAARNLFYQYLWNYPLTFVFVWIQNVLKTLFGLFSTQLKVLIEPAVHGGDCSFFAIKGSITQRIQDYITGGITHRWLLWVAYFEVAWSMLRWELVMFGFGFLLYEKKYGLVCIFVLCIVLFSFVTGMDGCCRYRITFEPILILLSAYALAHKRSREIYEW